MHFQYPAGKMFIYFGSQTGTAEGFARVVMEDGQKHGFEAKTMDLEDFDPNQLKDARLAVFLMATYGEGDPTDNALKFTNWITLNDKLSEGDEKKVSPTFLSNLSFCVFGLGNKQYENYNKMGKLVNSKLTLLGSKMVITANNENHNISNCIHFILLLLCVFLCLGV